MCQAMLTLQNEDKTLTFKVKANWEESSFDLTVFADEAWRVFLSEDEIERLASERNQTAKDYYATLRGYLTDVNPAVCFNLSYEKDADKDDETAEFTITRKTGARALLFFSSKLKKVDFHKCIYNLLDDLMEKHNELSTRVQALQKEKSDIEREKNIYEDKLIEFIERKTKWEQEMYSNFLLLLNEKKKRIKFLTTILKRKNIDPNELSLERQCELPSKKRSKRSNQLEQLSDSESSNYSGTDDYDTESSATEHAERHEPTPSTSRQNLSLEEPGDGDTHLVLPKRVKEAKSDEVIVLKPSPSNDKQTDPEESETLTPQLEFSTQELIDRM